MSLFATFIEALVQVKRRKIALPQDYYARHMANARARSFTVSGLAGLGQIAQVLGSLTDAIQAGKTFEEWKVTALANVPELANLPNGRLSTIYRNAMQNAYNAGRYEQMRTNPRKKYWLYDGVIDSRTSDICRALDGKIYPADSPVWRSIHPPNHHNCRSSLIGLSEEQAKARGYRPGTPDVVPPDGTPEPGWDTNPALGLDDALRLAAEAGNTALGRQYVKVPTPRQALASIGDEVAALTKTTTDPGLLAILNDIVSAVLIALLAQ